MDISPLTDESIRLKWDGQVVARWGQPVVVGIKPLDTTGERAWTPYRAVLFALDDIDVLIQHIEKNIEADVEYIGPILSLSRNVWDIFVYARPRSAAA